MATKTLYNYLSAQGHEPRMHVEGDGVFRVDLYDGEGKAVSGLLRTADFFLFVDGQPITKATLEQMRGRTGRDIDALWSFGVVDVLLCRTRILCTYRRGEVSLVSLLLEAHDCTCEEATTCHYHRAREVVSRLLS